MARISEADAVRLGLVKPKAGEASAPRRPKPGAVVPARRSSKGGRIPRTQHQDAFEVSFFVPLEPKTKERPRTSLSKPEIERAFMQSGGNPSKFRAILAGIKHHTYTPEDTSAFEGAVAAIAGASMRGRREPYASPVHVDFAFVMTGDEGHWPTDVTDPDLDNMEKAICDAINKVVWKDDRLMVSKRSIKLCGARTGIAVRIRNVTAADDELLRLAGVSI